MNRCTAFVFIESSTLTFGRMEKSLVERDKKVIWHPYTPQKYAPDPIPIVKGDGVHLEDAAGNRYIDGISSWWVNLHGHSHPYIAQKIFEQANTLEQVIFAGFTHEPAVRLAENLLKILPGDFSRIFYSDNGSTAVEVAIKMAVQYWWNISRESGVGSQEAGVARRESGVGGQESRVGSREGGVERRESGIGGREDDSRERIFGRDDRKGGGGTVRNKVLALKNSYHGDTFGAMSVSDRGIFTLAFQDKLFEVIFIDTADFESITNSLSGSAPTSGLNFNPKEIACFIYEPLVQGAGGMIMYDSKSLNDLLLALRKRGIICIADEVMTGFGRTGKLFASDYIEQKPDIICLSKGLTGGTMAMGVTACSKQIHDAYVDDDRRKTFFHGHSFTANPLACTAGIASLDLLLEAGCLERIKRISEQHRQFISGLQTRDSGTRRKTKNHRCLGTIMAFEVEAGSDDYLNTVSTTITQKALQNGVFIRPLGNTVYVMPPYCISEVELQKIYDVIQQILEQL